MAVGQHPTRGYTGPAGAVTCGCLWLKRGMLQSVDSPTSGGAALSRPVIGLALSGGGFRAGAHVGVLKVMLEHGLRPTIVAGSSAGALIAALYASGVPPGAVERYVLSRPWRPFPWLALGRFGLGNGRRFHAFLKDIFGGRRIEELRTLLVITSSDLGRGEAYLFDRGPIADAVYASCALPGLFSPLIQDGRVLADGSILAHLPARMVRERGADVTVGVVTEAGEWKAPRHAFDVALRAFDVMASRLAVQAGPAADVLIRVPVQNWPTLRYATFEPALRAGERAARDALPDLRSALRHAGRPLDERRGFTSPPPSQPF